ncbi:MAG: PQQ-dependent dehydrogenase, methanol/ethanol family [Gammaproteobacteria bacterium]|nr:PQQ-dependent dehydrogenase, methanol/ethanol family [Gammaproteobacteria bacterium]
MKKRLQRTGTILLIPLLTGATFIADPVFAGSLAGNISQQRVTAEDGSGRNWLLNGGSLNADHYSPLDQIHDGNVGRLGLAWSLDMQAPDGLAATPIVVDGIIYLSGPFSVVWAVDGRDGRLLWRHEPRVRLDSASSSAWSARVNRGVAVWHGRVIVGTADCRLIALDAGSGEPLWSRQVCDTSSGYKINAAPVVGGDLVFTGNGGSESGLRNRGYVSAHEVESGKEVWRFYTVPSGTASDQQSHAMRLAAQTWSGDTWKQYGGGGSVWDSMTYDAETGLLFFGTAGALPYIHEIRSPGGGDNLFTESIVAVRAETGGYVWHYQTVPGDNWEYNATMNIVLAELEINGARRRVLMNAPKNGFLYVLDRVSGELLSANNYTRVNWATEIDPGTGRPVFNPEARYWERPGEKILVWPNSWGAHSWNPMAYHPATRLVYIPSIDLPDEVLYVGGDDYYSDVVWPADADGSPGVPSRLVAWDPRAQRQRWAVNHDLPLNGGVLATGGNLVFQGTATGRLQAIAADAGKVLWSLPVGSAISAAPVTYLLDGVQYVLAPTGGGGGLRMVYPDWAAGPEARGPSYLLAFTLNGRATLPAPVAPRALPEPPPMHASTRQVAAGGKLYHDEGCYYCHGQNARAIPGSVPDLRFMSAEKHAQWHGIVIGGASRRNGMMPVEITTEESEAIRAYVLDRAWADFRSAAE